MSKRKNNKELKKDLEETQKMVDGGLCSLRILGSMMTRTSRMSLTRRGRWRWRRRRPGRLRVRGLRR